MIKGLRDKPEFLPPKLTMGRVDANVEMLSLFGLVDKRNKSLVHDYVEAQFEDVMDCGRLGERHLYIPDWIVSLDLALEVFDGRPVSHHPARSTVSNEFRAKLSNRLVDFPASGITAAEQVHGRLVVHGTESSEEPLLHFLGNPFDTGEDTPTVDTQLDLMSREAMLYLEEEHGDYVMSPFDIKSAVLIGLARRIQSSEAIMPLEGHTMIDPTRALARLGCGVNLAASLFFDNGAFHVATHVANEGYEKLGVGLTIGPDPSVLLAA